MKRGKYEAQNKVRIPPFFWVILTVFLILGTMVLFKSCTNSGTSQTPPPAPSYTDPQADAAAPSTQPSTEPATEPATQPTTEPVTEPTTPTTQPTEPTETVAPESDSTLGTRVVATAKSALGKPYAKGGNGPDGFDTSGLIRYCFSEAGISVPRTTSAQFTHGEAVERENLQPGDVVFFYLETPGKADYMGIYTGKNTFITVSSSENAVIERNFGSSYHKEHFVGARRYIPNNTTNP